MPQREFHAAHARVEHGGAEVDVGCTACHATAAAPAGEAAAATGEAELAAAQPGKSCFRCHTGGEEHVNAQCASCHSDEHQGGLALARIADGDPSLAPAAAAPTPSRSLARGGAMAALAFLPLLGVALVRRARRRERAERLVEELHKFPVEVVKRLVHSINVDKCVGCHMCIQACPASVLELVNHKSTVVNFDSCIQCRRCEVACAFDALRMHEADKPPPMIQMPEVDANFQTPVRGMYLIGQASGTPQVKNASNLGRAVVQHMVREGLRPGSGHAVGAQVDVIVVGSGPAGLSAALTCMQMGLSYLLLEKQRDYAWTVRNYYHKGKEVMAEPGEVEMVGLLPVWDTRREDLLAAWDGVIRDSGLQIQNQQDVTDVQKQGELFVVTVSDSRGQPTHTWSGARVVLAIGTMGNPRRLGCDGDDLPKVRNSLVDPDEWRGRDVLVVGGTDSAIEVVLALCEHNRVWLSCRGAKFDRVKPKNLKAIEALFAAGKCTPLFATSVRGVGEGSVVIEHLGDKRSEELPNHVVFAMIGGNPPIKWLQQIGVPYVDKPHSWSPPRTDLLARP
jgi:thioredoxin reductase/ferredoxin